MGQFDSVLNNPQTRRTFLRSMAVAGGMGVLAACRKDVQSGGTNGGASAAASAIPPMSAETGELKIHEWAGYEAKWLWRNYAKAGLPEPKFSFLTNTEGAIAKTAGGFYWDLTHPEIGYIQDYYDLGAIQPWDTSLIPNFSKLNPVLQEAGQLDGEQYEIVLDWGYSGVIIRSDEVDPSINSYSYLFDDALAGRISWFDTPWIIAMAHVTLGLSSDPLDASAEDLQAAKAYCIEKTKNLHSIWVDYTQMWDDVSQGNIWAAYSWPDTYVVLKEDVPVEYIKPKEGVFTWAEGLILNSGTENYHHAHAFADAWADVTVGQRLVSTWGYGHSNLDIDLSQIDPDVVQAFGLEDPEGSLNSGILDAYQPQRANYNRAWDEVKAAAG
jgi:spermidine/putrescine transport system substrate-binding protein